MAKIRVGLIGYGYWGPNFARLISEADNAELVYCADVLENSLQQVKNKYPKVNVTKNYQDILSDSTVDVVFVVTPTKTHFTIAKDSLMAGKHVFVEKPLTNTIETSQQLVDIAKKKKKKLMVGHVFLFNPSVTYIKDILNKKELGAVRHLHFQRRNLGPIRKDVNVLWDLAPHDISMLLYFIQESPLSVIASGECYLQKNIHDVVSASIRFKNGVMANFIFSWIDPVKIRDITIVGSKKMLLFNDVDTAEKIKIYDKNVDIVKDTRGKTFGEFQIALHSGDIYIPAIENKEPLKEEFRHFISCINENKLPKTDGESGLQVVKVLTAMQKSLENSSVIVMI